mmetsp:Transcript_19251/g.54602  ORF Transcript_19251/g.54602 Transcript_19251/m.54602 type:complete len:271 (+) Transcript_19251:684-1496(+)
MQEDEMGGIPSNNMAAREAMGACQYLLLPDALHRHGESGTQLGADRHHFQKRHQHRHILRRLYLLRGKGRDVGHLGIRGHAFGRGRCRMARHVRELGRRHVDGVQLPVDVCLRAVHEIRDEAREDTEVRHGVLEQPPLHRFPPPGRDPPRRNIDILPNYRPAHARLHIQKSVRRVDRLLPQFRLLELRGRDRTNDVCHRGGDEQDPGRVPGIHPLRQRDQSGNVGVHCGEHDGRLPLLVRQDQFQEVKMLLLHQREAKHYHAYTHACRCT